MRLWELEQGDENGEMGFAGGRGAQDAQALQQAELEAAALEEAMVRDEEIVGVDEVEANINAEPERPVLNINGGRVAVAQEGPLVLRIDAGAQPGPRRGHAEQQQAAAPPAARQQPRAGGPNRNRGNPGVARQQHHHQQQQQPGQRGRGGRGGRGRGVGPRQNGNHQPNQGQAIGRRDRPINQQVQQAADQQDEVQDVDAAWIRHFVHLALEDNEDLIDFEDE